MQGVWFLPICCVYGCLICASNLESPYRVGIGGNGGGILAWSSLYSPLPSSILASIGGGNGGMVCAGGVWVGVGSGVCDGVLGGRGRGKADGTVGGVEIA